MQLPIALHPGNESIAIGYLQTYFTSHTGRLFHQWDSTGTARRDQDVITSDDLIAVTLLGVSVPPSAAVRLLSHDRRRLSALLADVRDIDLVKVNPDSITPDWPARQLWSALRAGHDGIGPTTASKLLARKRPHLIPIADSVVLGVAGNPVNYWASLCHELRREDRALHRRLVALRSEAGFTNRLSPLRVFDVVAWMEGKERERDGTADWPVTRRWP